MRTETRISFAKHPRISRHLGGFPLMVALLCGSPLFALDPCFIHLGSLVSSESGERSDILIYELGTGPFTQLVRVVPKDKTKPSWVEKRYFDIPKFIMEAAAYEKLSEVIEGPGHNTTFKMVKAEPQPNQTIRLEDVKGVALDKALKDTSISDEVKGSLRTVYRMKLKALERLIRAKHPDAKMLENDFDGLPSHHYLVGDARNRTEIFIKSAQIIVSFDPTDPRKFSMTIVDAY